MRKNEEIRSQEAEINIRNLESENLENSSIIEMRAVVFNSNSNDLGGFIERIEPSDLDEVREALKRSDIEVLYNHKEGQVPLARYSNSAKDTLELEVDKDGIICRFEPNPDHPELKAIQTGIDRGDIRSCSFAFNLKKEHSELQRDERGRLVLDDNGNALRTIRGFNQFFDMSIVNRPAYSDTKIGLRSLEEAKDAAIQEELNQDLYSEVEQYLKKNIDNND